MNCYYPTAVVGSGKSEGHTQNNILAAENHAAELILGKPQSWHGPQPTCCPRNAVAWIAPTRSWCRGVPGSGQ